MARTTTYGPNGTATRATLERLGADASTDALAALAAHLADHLDTGEARSQAAAVSRELRATLADLAGRYAINDDALEDLLGRLNGAE